MLVKTKPMRKTPITYTNIIAEFRKTGVSHFDVLDTKSGKRDRCVLRTHDNLYNDTVVQIAVRSGKYYVYVLLMNVNQYNVNMLKYTVYYNTQTPHRTQVLTTNHNLGDIAKKFAELINHDMYFFKR